MPGSGPLNLAPKVAASLLGSWLTTIVLYVLHRYVDANLPVEVGAAIVGVVAFACGWLAPPASAPPADPSAANQETTT